MAPVRNLSLSLSFLDVAMQTGGNGGTEAETLRPITAASLRKVLGDSGGQGTDTAVPRFSADLLWFKMTETFPHDTR